MWRRTRENEPWPEEVNSTYEKAVLPARMYTCEFQKGLLFSSRASLINREHKQPSCKAKMFTLMLPRKQTLQHMHLHTSSRMWLTAHTPTNCAVTEWLTPLRHPKRTWTWALLCNCSATTYDKYALRKLPKGVTYCAHTIGISGHVVTSSATGCLCSSTHPSRLQVLHLKGFLPRQNFWEEIEALSRKTHVYVSNLVQELSH